MALRATKSDEEPPVRQASGPLSFYTFLWGQL